MFARSLAIVVLLAVPAMAEPLTLTGTSQSLIQNDPPPALLTFELFKLGTLITGGAIPGIMYSNPGQWIIDETNAASYGFDWAAAESGAIGPEKRIFGVGINGTHSSSELAPYSNSQFLSEFQMNQIELTLVNWSSTHHSFTTRWTIHGEGLIAPEPSTLVMGFLVHLLVHRVRKRLVLSNHYR